jgi:WD40 repeat protein
VAIIDTATGTLVRPPVRAHNELTPWVSFSPDGSQAVSGAMDGTVVVWDVATGEVAGRVSIGGGGMGSAPVFLADGRILIPPWGIEPAVYTWDPSTAHAVEFACRAAGRDLTPEEWREHFGTVTQLEICPPSPQ